MKKIILAAACLLVMSTTLVFAGTTEPRFLVQSNTSIRATPPPPVLFSFTSIFGNVPVREWKLRSNGNWRAHFMRNGIAWEATFTSTGVLVKSERD